MTAGAAGVDFPEWWWDSYDGSDEEEQYLPCVLCSHDMVNECGIGERDYFEPGRHLCVCCSDDGSDPNEYQPA